MRHATRVYWRDVCGTGIAHKLLWTREPGALGYERACDSKPHRTIIACATYWPKSRRRCQRCLAMRARRQS